MMLRYSTFLKICDNINTGIPLLISRYRMNHVTFVDILYIVNWFVSMYHHIVLNEMSLLTNLVSLYYLSHVRTLRFLDRKDKIPFIFLFILWHDIFSYNNIYFIKLGIVMNCLLNVMIIHITNFHVKCFYTRFGHIIPNIMALLSTLQTNKGESEYMWSSVIFHYWCAIASYYEEYFLVCCNNYTIQDEE